MIEIILGLPTLAFFYFFARRRASVYDNPHLLPEDPIWRPNYKDIRQCEKIGSSLRKVCVISKERENLPGDHFGVAWSGEAPSSLTESRWFISFGVTHDGEILDLKQGGSMVEKHAKWLASHLSIECEVG